MSRGSTSPNAFPAGQVHGRCGGCWQGTLITLCAVERNQAYMRKCKEPGLSAASGEEVPIPRSVTSSISRAAASRLGTLQLHVRGGSQGPTDRCRSRDLFMQNFPVDHFGRVHRSRSLSGLDADLCRHLRLHGVRSRQAYHWETAFGATIQFPIAQLDRYPPVVHAWEKLTDLATQCLVAFRVPVGPRFRCRLLLVRRAVRRPVQERKHERGAMLVTLPELVDELTTHNRRERTRELDSALGWKMAAQPAT